MHIRDFHSKLTSGNEKSGLFRALRNLSLFDDPKALTDGVSEQSDWSPWSTIVVPPSAADLAVEPV